MCRSSSVSASPMSSLERNDALWRNSLANVIPVGAELRPMMGRPLQHERVRALREPPVDEIKRVDGHERLVPVIACMEVRR